MRSFLLCTIVAVLVILGLFLYDREYRASLLRTDCFFLQTYHDEWLKAGAPVAGEALAKFREKRQPDIVVSNRLFVINAVPYCTQLAATNLRGRNGTLFVSTNGVMLLEEAPKMVKVVPWHQNKK